MSKHSPAHIAPPQLPTTSKYFCVPRQRINIQSAWDSSHWRPSRITGNDMPHQIKAHQTLNSVPARFVWLQRTAIWARPRPGQNRAAHQPLRRPARWVPAPVDRMYHCTTPSAARQRPRHGHLSSVRNCGFRPSYVDPFDHARLAQSRHDASASPYASVTRRHCTSVHLAPTVPHRG